MSFTFPRCCSAEELDRELTERTSRPVPVSPPGGANDHTRWDAAGVRAAPAERCTVYAIDGRGLGESGDAEACALEREFEDVAAVVGATDGPVTPLGHSSGALLAMEAALRTDDLRALVLYEPPVALGEHVLDVDDAIADMEELLDDGENEEVLVVFLRDVAGIPPEEIAALRDAPNWQKRVDGAHTVPRAIRGVSEYVFDATRFAAMATPTVLFAGGESPTWVRDGTEAIHEALPDSRIVTFDGHGHVAMLTATDRFVDEVLAVTLESNERAE